MDHKVSLAKAAAQAARAAPARPTLLGIQRRGIVPGAAGYHNGSCTLGGGGRPEFVTTPQESQRLEIMGRHTTSDSDQAWSIRIGCPVAAIAIWMGVVLRAASALAADGADPIGPRCPDPAIIEAKNKSGYYVFSTGHGIPVWYSTNLRDWRPVGRVFPSGVPSWAAEAVPKARGIWAPDVSYFGGKYHLYYAVSTFGSQRSVIGLAVNETLDAGQPGYRWEDRGLVIESVPDKCDFNAIDPALFVDRDGTPYLFWGSYWSGIKATRVDAKTGKPADTPPAIVPVAARAPNTDPPAIEAPYVILHDGFYYLFVSWDFCCAGVNSTYKVMVGRSKSALGPYVDSDGRRMLDGHAALVLEGDDRWRGPGHNSVLQTDQGDWLVHSCYDARRPGRERVLNVRPMTWKDGWPVAGEPLPWQSSGAGP